MSQRDPDRQDGPGPPAESPLPAPGQQPRQRGRAALIATAALLLLAAVTLRWGLVPYRVLGPSMEPLLRGAPLHGEGGVEDAGPGDIVLVDRISLRWRRPSRFEVVVLDAWPDSGLPLDPDPREGPGAAAPLHSGLEAVKRVVGLPGETVWIQDGALWIDGAPLSLPLEVPGPLLRKGPYGLEPTRLGPQECFVLGDNTYLSRDSRMLGPVPLSSLHGRVVAIVYPLRRAGFLPLRLPGKP